MIKFYVYLHELDEISNNNRMNYTVNTTFS